MCEREGKIERWGERERESESRRERERERERWRKILLKAGGVIFNLHN